VDQLDTRQRGDLAEAAVVHAFKAAGIAVLLPFGGFQAYDLVVDLPGGRLVRVQVKSGRVREGCVIFNCRSTDHGRGQRGYKGRADVFAVHATTGVYVIDVAAATATVTALRLIPTRNAQRQRVRMAADHTLDAWLGDELALTEPR
jgi:hypothetical protein